MFKGKTKKSLLKTSVTFSVIVYSIIKMVLTPKIKYLCHLEGGINGSRIERAAGKYYSNKEWQIFALGCKGEDKMGKSRSILMSCRVFVIVVVELSCFIPSDLLLCLVCFLALHYDAAVFALLLCFMLQFFCVFFPLFSSKNASVIF